MSILTPKTDFDNYADRTKFLLSWRISVVMAPILLILTILQIFDETNNWISYLAGFGIVVGSLTYLGITKNFRHVFIIFGMLGTLLIHLAANTILNVPHYADFLWITLVIFLSFFGVGIKWGIGILAMNMVATSYFVFVSMNKHIALLGTLDILDLGLLMLEIVMASFLIGYVIYQFIVIHRMGEEELVKANKELALNNELISVRNNEKTVLLKEIHHRVKNNLQIIISLLRLQQSELENSEARSKFSEMTNRVMVMSSIHQKLYQQEDLTNIDLEQYTRELSEELKEVYGTNLPIDIDVNCDYQHIDLKTIVPVGLLLNELLSNSFKYAFETAEDGEIKIDIQDRGDNFKLVYSDNGCWKESAEKKSGFGLELIDILTEQLNGEQKLDRAENGTTYDFDLKKLN